VKYIPLFPDAHLAKTLHLSLAEQGALLRLFMHAWMSGTCSLPNDEQRLAQILGITPGRWKKLRAAVMAFWVLEDNAWIQPRLVQEWNFVREKSNKARAAARKRHDQPSN
jgi:uncharacterized protein YdaU (DUF1376 family)